MPESILSEFFNVIISSTYYLFYSSALIPYYSFFNHLILHLEPHGASQCGRLPSSMNDSAPATYATFNLTEKQSETSFIEE